MPSTASRPPSASPGATGGSCAEHYALHTDPQSSHQQVADIVRRIGRSPVLDVGAAQGVLGQLLSRDGMVLDAVEPNPAWAARAQPYYRRVYTSPIEATTLPPHTYPVVVCADVLEHIVDPASVLQQLRHAATPDALFVVSLPNAVHLVARLLILAGQFPRMERGIFDKTHLHFYTRTTAEAMLRTAGLEIVEVRSTPVPLEQVWPARLGQAPLHLLMRLQRLGLWLRPTLFSFQWIWVVRVAAGSVEADDAARRGPGRAGSGNGAGAGQLVVAGEEDYVRPVLRIGNWWTKRMEARPGRMGVPVSAGRMTSALKKIIGDSG